MHAHPSAVLRRLVVLVLVALALVALTAAPATADGPDVEIPYETYVLDNGLTLIVHRDPKAPIVAVNVWYHVGSKNEKPGKTGFAHLFEHLMFNGSESYDDDYFKPLDEVGATEVNGTTNFDRTNYFQNVPVSALDRALFLESDRMGHLLGAITQDKLDEQRGVVQNEKRQGENQPYGLAYEKITEGTYPEGHPYSWTVIGSMEDLDAASLDDVHAWFEGYYGAANAVLVVAGDVDPQEVKAKVEHYFGDVPPGPPVARFDRWVARRDEPVRQRLEDNVPQARLYTVWNVPGYGTEDADLLDLLSDVLARGKSSRLYKRLVYDERLATDVSASLDVRELGSHFTIRATAVPGGGAAFIAGELADIEGQAIAGNCDIAVFAHWVDNHGDDQTVNLAWNHALQEYHLPSLATIAGDELVNFVTANQGHATFVGLPLGNMHWRSALDTDFEGLPDAAEIGQYGTAPDDRDTDGDGFSDWHEVVNEGMDPLVYNDFSTDETPPEFSVEPVATLTTTNTVKIEFQTNEPTRAVLTWGETTVTSPPVGVEDISHSMIVGGLPADTEVDLFVEIFDPADNRDSRHVLVTTDERIVPEVLTIHDLELVDHDPGAGTATVDVHLGTQLGTTPDGVYLSAAHVYYEDDANGLAVVDKNVVGCVVPLGDTIRYDVEDIPFGGSPESRKLHVTVWEVLHCPPIGPPFPLPLPSCLDILVDCLQQFPGKLIYVEGDDIENFATFDVP